MRPEPSGDPLARHSLSAGELKALLAAERVGQPFLAFKDDRGRLNLCPTGGTGETLAVGRRLGLDVSISWDSEVSGLHAELQSVGGEWTIVDDGLSRNGTYVNGRRISGRQRLRDGDRVRVGQTILAYKAARAMPVQETTSASEGFALGQVTETQRKILVALCRPYRDSSGFATPASNRQIAEELFLSLDAVKMHLTRLFSKFELGEIPQNEKRARLAERALQFGVISRRDLT
jgi:hypothetical protein